MPRYDFECSDGHLFEAFLLLAEYKDEIPCQKSGCEKIARRQYLPSGYVAQGFEPIVIHRSADGTISVPAAPDAPLREGYTKVELRTLREVRQIEHEMNSHARMEHEASSERRENFAAQQARERRANLLTQMKTQFGRDFARVAMERNDSRRGPAYEPGGYFEVFSNDRSNQEHYRDERTGWRGRK